MRARITTFAVAAAVLVAAMASSSAGAAAPTGQITVTDSEPGQVQLLFSASGLPAGAHLDSSSVKVAADGATLTATVREAGAQTDPAHVPARVVIMMVDASGSMAGDGLASARSAAVDYARRLPADVRVGLITFADAPHLLLAPTTDRHALSSALTGVQAKGDTTLYDAIDLAESTLAAADLPANAQRRLLILSDGDDTSSHASLPQLIASLQRQRIPADIVAFRLAAADQVTLSQIAAATGGRVLPASSATGLAGAFGAAAATFTQRVLLTVTVPNKLAGRKTRLTAQLSSRGQVVTAVTELTLPKAAPLAQSGSPARATTPRPAHSVGGLPLWLVLGLTFGGLLGLGLLALHLPGETDDRKRRIAQVESYRLISEVAQAPDPSKGRFVKTALSITDNVVRARGMRERIIANLDRAGVRLRPQEWVLLCVCVGVTATAVLTLLAGSLLIGVPIGAVATWAGSRLYLRIKIARRCAAFVVREGTQPAAGEIARALAENRLGADLEDALDGVAGRMRCRDLSWVVMAVRISREVGGNLAEVLMTTVHTMRERAQMRRQVRALTAEGRLSGAILVSLPLLIGGWLLLVRREYLRPLYTQPIGVAMLIGSGVLVALGSFWMSRLVKVEV